MMSLFTILHPLVDACSVTVLVMGGMSWQRVLAYNALAFALQFPMGVALDARPRLVKGAFAVSLALTLLGVGLGVMSFGLCGVRGAPALPWMALSAACVGNALFHLSAGKAVLDAHGGRGGPIGLFISTGALGLFAGMKLAGPYGLWCCLGFGAALAVVGALAVWRGLQPRYNHQKTKITLCRDCGGEDVLCRNSQRDRNGSRGQITRLEKSYQLISKVQPFGEKSATKNCLYRIDDCFFRFWFRFVYKYQHLIEQKMFDGLVSIVERDLDVFSGFALERYFRQKFIEDRRYTKIGGWWDRKGENEIDLVCENELTSVLNFYEVKVDASRISPAELERKRVSFYEKNPQLKNRAGACGGLSLADL